MHLIAAHVIWALQRSLQRLLAVLQGAPVQLRVVVDDDVVRRGRGLWRHPERRRREPRRRRVRLRGLPRRWGSVYFRWRLRRQLGCCLGAERLDGGAEGGDLAPSTSSDAGVVMGPDGTLQL